MLLTQKSERNKILNKLGLQLRNKSESPRRRYIPAFSRDFLTPLYDFMMKWAALESSFKPRLVEQADIKNDQEILDMGCGTATLTIVIKKTHPDAEVVGLDADPMILEIAKSKVAKAGVEISLDYGMSYELPYLENSFDRVISSMVFHHLTREAKVRSLKEILRVLKPEGELHVADFGKPKNPLMYLVSLVIGLFEETSDNVKGLLLDLLRHTGFD